MSSPKKNCWTCKHNTRKGDVGCAREEESFDWSHTVKWISITPDKPNMPDRKADGCPAYERRKRTEEVERNT